MKRFLFVGGLVAVVWAIQQTGLHHYGTFDHHPHGHGMYECWFVFGYTLAIVVTVVALMYLVDGPSIDTNIDC